MRKQCILYPFTARVSQRMTEIFTDETAIFAYHNNPATWLQYLQIHLDRINTCIKKSKISIIENKSKHVTFTTRRETCVYT